MINDPTKTVTLRRQSANKIQVRFNRIKRAVRSAFTVGNLLTNVRLASANEFEFTRDTTKVAAFNRFLQEQIDEEILRIDSLTVEELDLDNHWLNRDIGEGYRRGAYKTRLAAERAIPSLLKLPDYNPFVNPVHINRSELIFQRVYSNLEGVTQVMSKQMSNVLAEGIAKGHHPSKVASALVDRVDKIGITRAKLISRTEIIQSHNTGLIQEAELLELETGVEIKVIWITAIDGRERPAHHDRNQKIYTRKRALELIGEPNCRCGNGPVFDI
jgi:hypothetical protein